MASVSPGRLGIAFGVLFGLALAGAHLIALVIRQPHTRRRLDLIALALLGLGLLLAALDFLIAAPVAVLIAASLSLTLSALILLPRMLLLTVPNPRARVCGLLGLALLLALMPRPSKDAALVLTLLATVLLPWALVAGFRPRLAPS